MITLAHISDWHATTLEGATVSELATKRFFGWLSWKRKRRKLHRPEVLEQVFADVRACAPDHVVVTGDLTNVALPQEFAEASDSLRTLGGPDFVSLVPGNHDAYVGVEAARGWDRWAEYLADDSAAPAERAPTRDEYPTLRVRGEVAIVGLCSALPTPLFMASGRLGERQLARLEVLLAELGERELCRVVALHHPPTDRGIARRRRLSDWRALQAVLARSGAELVVHGHRHRTWVGSVPGCGAPIPVVGVRSASDIGVSEEKRAQYHLYRIERAAGDGDSRGGGARYRVSLEVRGYDREGGGFAAEGESRAL